MIRLTTVLAHSSGEWLSSEWPVCGVAEVADPRRMGAALTYARRYALFTLVGIAGEDDLDAPDLNAMNGDAQASPAGRSSNGYATKQTATPATGERKSASRASAQVLPEEQSGALRDRLAAEIDALPSAEEAGFWARDGLVSKNRLTTTDAESIEAAFRAKVASFGESELEEMAENDAAILKDLRRDGAGTVPPGQTDDAERLRLSGKIIRLRDKDHCRFISRLPCLICGRTPTDPHHLRYAQPRALSRKVSDEFTVPVCRLHHRELHRHGDEGAWWETQKIDPIPVALALWRQTRPDRAPGEARHRPAAVEAMAGEATIPSPIRP
jgi:ERF superfamily protein